MVDHHFSSHILGNMFGTFPINLCNQVKDDKFVVWGPIALGFFFGNLPKVLAFPRVDRVLGCPWYLVAGFFHPYVSVGWIRPVNR